MACENPLVFTGSYDACSLVVTGYASRSLLGRELSPEDAGFYKPPVDSRDAADIFPAALRRQAWT